MTKNKIHHIKNYNFYMGVPARFASPSGFPLIVLGRKAGGSILVADSSFLRSLCRSCCPAASALAGYPLQSLTQNHLYFSDFSKLIM